MANIKYMIRGKGNAKSIYVRFYKGREIDLQYNTGLLVAKEDWDPYPGKYRTGKTFPNSLVYQNRLDKLRTYIIDCYNDAIVKGGEINSLWLQQSVSDYFNKPGGVEASPKDLFGFCQWWLNKKAKDWRIGGGKTMDDRAIRQYQVTAELWREFQAKRTYLISDIGNSLISEFMEFLEYEKGYRASTTKRMAGRIKFFLARAEMEGLRVNMNYKERVYIGKKQDALKPYLDEDEINRIFCLDLSHDYKLDNIRDSLIIGLWTGLRVSDFNRNMNANHIDDGFITIKNQKTGAWVKIPIHPQVSHIIKKRHGLLPRRYNNGYFNAEIKKVCMLANIDQEIPGSRYNGKTKRSEQGTFKKWELVTSHTCRRSFASNLYGEIPNEVLADLGGWTNEKTMINYVKRTKAQSAEVLKNYWNEQYK